MATDPGAGPYLAVPPLAHAVSFGHAWHTGALIQQPWLLPADGEWLPSLVSVHWLWVFADGCAKAQRVC